MKGFTMVERPSNDHVELHNVGYYVAGYPSLSLDSVAYALRRGEAIEEILVDFPALLSRRELEGVIAFVEAQREAVDLYLTDKAERWERARELNPSDLVEKVRTPRHG